MRRQCNGAKHATEAADFISDYEMVGEHSTDRRRYTGKCAGGGGRENAGISIRKDG